MPTASAFVPWLPVCCCHGEGTPPSVLPAVKQEGPVACQEADFKVEGTEAQALGDGPGNETWQVEGSRVPRGRHVCVCGVAASRPGLPVLLTPAQPSFAHTRWAGTQSSELVLTAPESLPRPLSPGPDEEGRARLLPPTLYLRLQPSDA